MLTSVVAVVGGNYQQLRLGALDNVAPVDGVGVAQELVLVDVDAAAQYLCTGREKDRKRNERRASDLWRIHGTCTPWQEINTSRLTLMVLLSPSPVLQTAFPWSASEHEGKCYRQMCTVIQCHVHTH